MVLRDRVRDVEGAEGCREATEARSKHDGELKRAGTPKKEVPLLGVTHGEPCSL